MLGDGWLIKELSGQVGRWPSMETGEERDTCLQYYGVGWLIGREGALVERWKV
jgi:hypothetical protein